jgi:phosphatidylcholine synthase
MRPSANGPWTAIGVHVFTALGGVCAFFATLALIGCAPERMFLWLGAALLIDGLDGPLARRLTVAERLPRFSGERLDLVIDYLTYVFIPALALWQAGVLAGALGLALVAGILVSSLFHFADLESKAEDNSFVGFPAIWNLVAFYLFAFDAGPAAAALVAGAGIVLTFVPWRWVHPLRVRAWRPLTLAALGLWASAAAWTLALGFPAPPLAQLALIAAAAYGVGLTLVRRRG